MSSNDAAKVQMVTKSLTETTPKGIEFSAPKAKIAAIEVLAARGPAYDSELAYLMSVISAWAYADERVLGMKLRYYGFPKARIRRVSIVNNALLVDTTAYLIQSATGKVAVLAFRGTDPGNLITVLTDTQVMQQPYFGMRVHSGFHATVEVIWDEVHRALIVAKDGQHLDKDDQQVPLGENLEHLYITGHSLGGAMAILAAARISRQDYKDLGVSKLLKGVYTFGQPMVGDRKFADHCVEAFGDRLYRHVYHNDVVPRLPPKSSLEYAHCGGELRSSSFEEAWYKTKQQSTRISLLPAAIHLVVNAIEARTMSKDVLQGASIDDHMPPSYIEVSKFAVDPKTHVLAQSPNPLEVIVGSVRRVFRRLRSAPGSLTT